MKTVKPKLGASQLFTQFPHGVKEQFNLVRGFAARMNA
jgi:hypothetical protein